eukprot:scaffold55253_cov61-Phaeocystis_antarctica.AAC.11
MRQDHRAAANTTSRRADRWSAHSSRRTHVPRQDTSLPVVVVECDIHTRDFPAVPSRAALLRAPACLDGVTHVEREQLARRDCPAVRERTLARVRQRTAEFAGWPLPSPRGRCLCDLSQRGAAGERGLLERLRCTPRRGARNRRDGERCGIIHWRVRPHAERAREVLPDAVTLVAPLSDAAAVERVLANLLPNVDLVRVASVVHRPAKANGAVLPKIGVRRDFSN